MGFPVLLVGPVMTTLPPLATGPMVIAFFTPWMSAEAVNPSPWHRDLRRT